MKTIITYVAADGMRFEDKDKCIAYEVELRHAFAAFVMNVEFLDKDGKRMLPDNIKNWAENEMCYNELEHIYDTCTYIYIKNDLSPEVIKYNEDNYGFIIPTKQGKYYDNDMTNEWKRIET